MPHKYKAAAFAIAIMVLSAMRVFSAPSAPAIDAAVKACVEVVHAESRPFKRFDAYYDQTTGGVHYNMGLDYQGLAFGRRHGCHTRRNETASSHANEI